MAPKPRAGHHHRPYPAVALRGASKVFTFASGEKLTAQTLLSPEVNAARLAVPEGLQPAMADVNEAGGQFAFA